MKDAPMPLPGNTLTESAQAVLGCDDGFAYGAWYQGTNDRFGNLFDFGTLKTRRFDGVSRAFKGAAVSVRRPGFIKIPAIARATAALGRCARIAGRGHCED